MIPRAVGRPSEPHYCCGPRSYPSPETARGCLTGVAYAIIAAALLLLPLVGVQETYAEADRSDTDRGRAHHRGRRQENVEEGERP